MILVDKPNAGTHWLAPDGFFGHKFNFRPPIQFPVWRSEKQQKTASFCLIFLVYANLHNRVYHFCIVSTTSLVNFLGCTRQTYCRALSKVHPLLFTCCISHLWRKKWSSAKVNEFPKCIYRNQPHQPSQDVTISYKNINQYKLIQSIQKNLIFLNIDAEFAIFNHTPIKHILKKTTGEAPSFYVFSYLTSFAGIS